jgi:hypothetical protein
MVHPTAAAGTVSLAVPIFGSHAGAVGRKLDKCDPHWMMQRVDASCCTHRIADTMAVILTRQPNLRRWDKNMLDYQIQAHTRRCTVTGRELKPEERYYTALQDMGDRFVRHDFSSEAWTGPPAGTFSYWCGRVPALNEPDKPRFDDNALEECFQRLEDAGEPGRVNFRYVVALLLIRRKRLRFEHSVEEDGVEKLQVCNVRSGARSLVVNPQLADEQMAEVQAEVFRVLGWN